MFARFPASANGFVVGRGKAATVAYGSFIGRRAYRHRLRRAVRRRNARQHDLFDFTVDGAGLVREIAFEVLGRAGWIASVHPDR